MIFYFITILVFETFWKWPKAPPAGCDAFFAQNLNKSHITISQSTPKALNLSSITAQNMHALSISNCCQSTAHTCLFFWTKNGHWLHGYFFFFVQNNKSAAVSGRCTCTFNILLKYKISKTENEKQKKKAKRQRKEEKKSIRNSNNIIIKHTKGWMYCGNSQSSSRVYVYILNYLRRHKKIKKREREIIFEAHCESISKTIAFTFRYGQF